jgi:hypothetical protein
LFCVLFLVLEGAKEDGIVKKPTELDSGSKQKFFRGFTLFNVSTDSQTSKHHKSFTHSPTRDSRVSNQKDAPLREALPCSTPRSANKNIQVKTGRRHVGMKIEARKRGDDVVGTVEKNKTPNRNKFFFGGHSTTTTLYPPVLGGNSSLYPPVLGGNSWKCNACDPEQRCNWQERGWIRHHPRC